MLRKVRGISLRKAVKCSLEEIKNVVKGYGIHPYKIEKLSKRLYKVSDGQHEYALKESKLTENSLAKWENVFHQAYSENLSTILPVYLTKQSKLYELYDRSYYYLTPWLAANSINHQQVIKNVYNAIGEIHAKTKRTQSIQTASVIKNFSEYQLTCADLHKKFLHYVNLFEKNRFMSPFELLVCTQYRVMEQVLTVMNSRIDQFLDELQGDVVWNYSMCHRNLNLSHIIHHQKTYIINWEETKYDNGIVDLSFFLKQQVRYYDQSSSQLTEMFSAYTSKNKLTEGELYLLVIYLLDPFPYIKLIQNYINNPSNNTMINQIKLLQHASRQLLLGLEWSEFVDNESAGSSENDQDS